jgi:tetratricopeptide (TPR) repeat protein
MGARSTLILFLGLARSLVAQAGGARAVQEAIDLERRGRHEEAAARYRAVLADERANTAALLGLERTLEALRRTPEILPYVRAALAADSSNRIVRAMELRVWAAVGEADSAAAAAQRWITLEPRSPEPYREWASAASRRGDVDTARRILVEGSRRVGDASLLQDVAQVNTLAGEWGEAARHWLAVVRTNPALLATASANLARAPPAERDAILAGLLAGTVGEGGGRRGIAGVGEGRQGTAADAPARLLASDLLAGWGRPGEAWALLDAALPADRVQAVAHLTRFTEKLRAVRTREGTLSRAYAFERLLGLSSGPAADRVRLQAAQAYAEAGRLEAAEQLLRGLTQGGTAGGGAVATAMASVIGAMAQEGLVEEAEERLRQWESRLPVDARRALTDAVGWGWLARGELDRAERLIDRDSTVEGAALRGWIALFRGELAVARERFREAGPYAGSRAAATDRTAILALLERVELERSPDVGRALHALAKRDTAAALAGLERVAARVPATGGRAELLALAGRLATETHQLDKAEQLLRAAVATDSAGPAAPTAELLLARVHRDQGKLEVAAADLEHLIVSHPESAEVPHARRMLDQLRGRVP